MSTGRSGPRPRRAAVKLYGTLVAPVSQTDKTNVPARCQPVAQAGSESARTCLVRLFSERVVVNERRIWRSRLLGRPTADHGAYLPDAVLAPASAHSVSSPGRGVVAAFEPIDFC